MIPLPVGMFSSEEERGERTSGRGFTKLEEHGTLIILTKGRSNKTSKSLYFVPSVDRDGHTNT